MKGCAVCGSQDTFVLLDCGSLPLCNRYLADVGDVGYEHRLILGCCGRCGAVQLLNDPVPVAEIMPRYSWLTYREPEDHLDKLADALVELPGLSEGSVYCGASYKDDSLLERMKMRGFVKAWRIDPAQDLDIQFPGVGVESVQDRLDPKHCGETARRYGRADVLIVRHMLEHAYDVHRMMQGLRELLKPGGFLILEVPDCTQALETKDYSTLWEEHTLYFTPETLKTFCASANLEIVSFEVVSYALENSLVAITRFADQGNDKRNAESIPAQERRRALEFGADFAGMRVKVRRWMADFRQRQGKIALLGAGHLSCMFLNLFQLREYIDLVVDDDPNKQGLLMPGSRLPIRGSSALLEENIRLCLLGVNPQIEDSLARRQARFIDNGGMLASIFFSSKRALTL